MRFAAVMLLTALGASPAAQADDASPANSHAQLAFGTGQDGSPGLHRVSTAQPAGPGELVLSLSGQYFSASSFLVTGDSDKRWIGTPLVSFAPLDFLSVWASWRASENTNDRLTPKSTSYRGTPALGVRLSFPVARGLDAGVLLSALVPTSAGGGGLDANAAVYQATGIVSYEVARTLVLAANVGYVIDQSSRLFKGTVTAQQRFVAGIYGANVVAFGVGAQSSFELSPDIALGGFAELTGSYAVSALGAINPLRATLGLKTRIAPLRGVELAAGSDVRITGAPKQSSTFPGVPPWEAFVRLVGHWSLLAKPDAPPPPPAPPPCGPSVPCGTGLVCEDGTCVEPKPPPPPKPAPPPEPPPTFGIHGTIIDRATRSPLAQTKVTVSGFNADTVPVDGATGQFTLGPIPIDGGLVRIRVEASGYRPAEETIAKGAPNSVTEVAFEMIPLAKSVPAVLKGTIVDADTGKPIRGLITIRTQKKRTKADETGTFSIELRAGRYDVTIASPGHIVQIKTVELKPGDVVILNVDMTPRRR